MKKKALITCLVASIVLNLLFTSLLIYKNNDKSVYEKRFISEIGFAIDRLEDYTETSSEGEYIVAVAHLYSAYTMLANFDESKWTYKQIDDFQKLWNISASYPKIMKANLSDIIDILSMIKEDGNFNNPNGLQRLHEVISEIIHSEK